MTFEEYEFNAMQTGNRKATDELTMAVGALGLTGEAGEAADLVKKHLEQGHPLDLEKLEKEVGDVLWYCAYLARYVIGKPLSQVADTNIIKLRKRYPEGRFDLDRSKNRVE